MNLLMDSFLCKISASFVNITSHFFVTLRSRVFKLKKVAGGNCKVAGVLSHLDEGGLVG